MITLSPSSPSFKATGRWTIKEGSIFSSWSGSSLRFMYQSKGNIDSRVSIVTGASTERKDQFNGGTPMICVSVSEMNSGSQFTRINQQTYDVGDIGIRSIPILTDVPMDTVRLVKVTLIDWASLLEIQSIVIGEYDQAWHPPSSDEIHDILLIGDSFACGFTDGSQTFPFGTLSAFPQILQDTLAKGGLEAELTLVAYPGIKLVDSPETTGMESKFFQVSPWSKEPFTVTALPSIMIISLGTNDDSEDVPEERFIFSMLKFITALISVPGSHCKKIFILEPFMDFNESFSSTTYDISTLVDRLSVANPSAHFHAIHTRQILQKSDTIDGLHPNLYPAIPDPSTPSLRRRWELHDKLASAKVDWISVHDMRSVKAVFRKDASSATIHAMLKSQYKT
ncbi:hypothetical protein BT96DRAFT_995814 [Gymnopus androsaceus JB14]|uniref:SGNH hydrolase-type esterase domain-containing protein n=1 Tax=Gymnopus androsaceus JB14 TaxID=1447944 RepID=A0A6A4HI41_9AGAR|nr:hypothetical protein BT96DRAFT_995814 [Gymnopus androsaceus JB14]